MKDDKIVELIYENDERGLHAAEAKYSGLCHSVAENILALPEDREECINDTWLALWNSIPPERPTNLCAFIAKLVKNIALKRSRANSTWKRCANYNAAGDDLLELIPSENTVADEYESKRIGEIINAFLAKQIQRDRDVFVLRFWYRDTVPQISASMGLSESLVKSLLSRMKKKLREELREEGIIV